MAGAMIHKINISDLGWDGRGVGRLENGRVVFVEGAIPGDNVSIAVREINGRKQISTELVEIIERSPLRQEHPCPHNYQGCPGCLLGAMQYKAGLKWKRNHLYETLKRIGGMDEPDIREIEFNENNWRYRDRIELQLTINNSPSLCYRTLDDNFIDIDDCLLASDNISSTLKAINERLRTIPIDFEMIEYLEFKEPRILLRDNGLGGTIAVVFSENAVRLADNLKEILHIPELAGFQIRQTEHIKSRFFNSKLVYQGGDTKILYKFDENHNMIIDTTVFTQTNLYLYQKLANLVVQLLPEKGRIADIYGGFGAFAIYYTIAKGGKADVYESSLDAVAAGQRFADINGLPINYIRKDMHHESRKKKDWRKYDVIILDPPRKGTDKILLKDLDVNGPGNIVYVSCHPAALARDIKILTRYQPTEFIPIDMFPQTPDLETIALLNRK